MRWPMEFAVKVHQSGPWKRVADLWREFTRSMCRKWKNQHCCTGMHDRWTWWIRYIVQRCDFRTDLSLENWFGRINSGCNSPQCQVFLLPRSSACPRSTLRSVATCHERYISFVRSRRNMLRDWWNWTWCPFMQVLHPSHKMSWCRFFVHIRGSIQRLQQLKAISAIWAQLLLSTNRHRLQGCWHGGSHVSRSQERETRDREWMRGQPPFLTGCSQVFLLQKEFLITECVAEAATSNFVQRCIDYHLQMVPGDRSERLLELSDIWPSKRRRWWMIISKGHYGKVQIPPLPKLAQTPTIAGLIPEFLQVTQLEREQLLPDCTRATGFHNFGKGIISQIVDKSGPLSTALHSWGNQLLSCACGCRPAFSEDLPMIYRCWSSLRAAAVLKTHWSPCSSHHAWEPPRAQCPGHMVLPSSNDWAMFARWG